MSQGIENLRTRISFHGGSAQQERMIKDKRRSLDSAIKSSYQGAIVKKLNSHDKIPALINPNKLNQDYDDKNISAGFEYKLKAGDIFSWHGSYWLIYSQHLTELAYFRGACRRCRYEVKWKDENGKIHQTWAAIKGPVEKSIKSIIKSDNVIDIPNYSLSILLPASKDVLEHFQRYTKFYLQGNETCWRVEATDAISEEGILELAAKEYYANQDQDDVEKGIVDEFVPIKIDTDPENPIQGELFIKPKLTYTYSYNGNGYIEWLINGKSLENIDLPIMWSLNDTELTITWTENYTDSFILSNGDSERKIQVESLF